MILSMTGFGRASVSSPQKKITVELKSLNSKQLDLTIRVPSCFRELEVEARTRILKVLERGKIELTASVENLVAEAPATINTDVARVYMEQIKSMDAALGIADPQDWQGLLLRMPDVMKTEASHLDEGEADTFLQALDLAMQAIDESRIREGEKLYDFFKGKISNIEALLEEVEPFERERVPKIKARLEEQLSRLTSIEYDRGRLEQELIFYIEKLDVNEEKQRLGAHLNYFLETLGRPDGGIVAGERGKGKKLGFIAQEMGREINTLGSKANDAEMQKIVVRMKDELEQIKEQVLNVL